MNPVQILSSDHSITEEQISEPALKVLRRLHACGFKAYLAGGCIRDLLLGRAPKDFDVVTDATPREVKNSFRNCRLIGRRFRLAHIHFPGEMIEVSTFRSPVQEEESEEATHLVKKDGLVVRDNLFGTPEEDALRRDFTVNALFMSYPDYTIIDYAGGLADLEKKVIHCIGDPRVRYREDPVRMIRAIRFSAALGLPIEEQTLEAIRAEREQLAMASAPRLYDEVLKFFFSGASREAFKQLEDTGLLTVLFPQWGPWLEKAGEADRAWVLAVLGLMDKWKAHGRTASPALLFALLFGSYHRHMAEDHPEEGIQAAIAAIRAHHDVLRQRILIPRRDLEKIVYVTCCQDRFLRMRGGKMHRFARRYYFPDALVFFKFACARSGEHQEDLERWVSFLQDAPEPDPEPQVRRPRRRRRKR